MSLYKQTDARQEAVDPAVAFLKASQLVRCHPGHELQWDGPGQSAQVPKQDNRGTRLRFRRKYMSSWAVNTEKLHHSPHLLEWSLD